ncbi:gluconate 2-dehydrogenase subunit 3 family protein [Flavobacterium soyangense]|uniref:Gluconate 2-dehydrogenase subunit 3 family protein n=1 Tax=Flavobacterium soyangense TaxID=2023265 RepID=A0A930XZN7_9FLAO|nr:gluconate 2-dehydrogenase subunit 3 family protein [Flavobacterium soyangense]MBF2707584.1 gluconate 2-dehydrogenase subunit 3 family protein [Flavobacterium soyangense]
MNRRSAIKGILAVAGLGYASVIGVKYFIGQSNKDRRKLKAQAALIAELTNVIIPPTTTPGAKEALVHEFIISYMEDCSSMKEYNNFTNGLTELQENCVSNYNKYFENCTAVQKNEIVKDLDSDSGSTGIISKISNKLQGRSFYDILKSLTIEGYCTSEMGATQHLVYQLIPGKYNAITQLSKNQKSWATK